MTQDARKVVIIGAGIAGLSAAVYAQKCGYQAEVLEMNDIAGGLAMSWRRGDYTFETCLHWLYGSNPKSRMYARWKEIFDIEKLTFLDPRQSSRLETPDGRSLTLYTNLRRLEGELLRKAPQDAAEIHRLVRSIRDLRKFAMLDPCGGRIWLYFAMLRNLPILPVLRRLSGTSCSQYSQRFENPVLRAAIGGGDFSDLPVLAMLLPLAWMDAQNAAYAVGGSQAIIRLIQQKLTSLGGRIRFGRKVERILTRKDTAVGVLLANGEGIEADWVISASDGHATLYNLLGGRYTPDAITKIYDEWKTFPSYVQVSLGVASDLKRQPPCFTRLLDKPLTVDPGTELHRLSFRVFNFDPTFAPPGKTAVTCFLPTRNVDYWVKLRNENPEAYRAEKRRVADAVIAVFVKRLSHLRGAIEVVDVSTPASVVRHTGNWKGSMEGWLPTPQTGFRRLPDTVPGLHRFRMIGQWVSPGGGLPSGLMTARCAVKAMCKEDGLRFAFR